jgi:two-component system sensor histidine kinase RegB
MLSPPRDIFEQSSSRLKLQTVTRLRWFAVLGQLAAILVVHFGLGYALPLATCLSLVAMSAWLNVFLRLRFMPRHRLNTSTAAVMLSYDILQLGALLFLTGGIQNPFVFLIVIPVTVSAATLPARNTLMLGALAAVVVVFVAAEHQPLPWTPGQTFELPEVYKWGTVAALAVGMPFLAFYTYRLSQEAGQMSGALAATELILAREQQLHALDGLAAAAAHELGTPLSTIVLVTKELSRAVGADSPHSEDLTLLQAQAQRCKEILQKLTRSPTGRDPLHDALPLSQLLREAAEPYVAQKAIIRISAEPDEAAGAVTPEPVGERRPGVIYGLGNLIENASDFAMSEVVVSARWSPKVVTVRISDDGPGFDATVMETLGEPYVTTRSLRLGGKGGAPTGLGLGFFIAKTLLERSGATVSLANAAAPDHGAIVTVIWSRTDFEGGLIGWPKPRVDYTVATDYGMDRTAFK